MRTLLGSTLAQGAGGRRRSARAVPRYRHGQPRVSTPLLLHVHHSSALHASHSINSMKIVGETERNLPSGFCAPAASPQTQTQVMQRVHVVLLPVTQQRVSTGRGLHSARYNEEPHGQLNEQPVPLSVLPGDSRRLANQPAPHGALHRRLHPGLCGAPLPYHVVRKGGRLRPFGSVLERDEQQPVDAGRRHGVGISNGPKRGLGPRALGSHSRDERRGEPEMVVSQRMRLSALTGWRTSSLSSGRCPLELSRPCNARSEDSGRSSYMCGAVQAGRALWTSSWTTSAILWARVCAIQRRIVVFFSFLSKRNENKMKWEVGSPGSQEGSMCWESGWLQGSFQTCNNPL
eukprot:jgi/Botrbrau1/3002/Bobra.0070s0001.1